MRLDLEYVHRARGEEDALARMAIRRGGQLALGELEDRLARVVQAQRALDLHEDPLPLVGDDHLGEERVLADLDPHLRGARVVDRVVDHLGGRVVPDVTHVLRESRDDRRDELAPDEVLLQALGRVAAFGLREGLEPVHLGAGRPFRLDQPVAREGLQVAVRDLAGHPGGLGKAGADTVAVGRDQIQRPAADGVFVNVHD